MINPEQRSLLTDALTPPDNYRFDCGVATTYSLDLVTLLTLPLHLARRDVEAASPEQFDPLPVLDAVRRMGDRLTIFCQRGRLHIPRKANALFGLLENMVQETQAPHERGVFHPKVWLLRFEPIDAAARGGPMLRLLVLTRNLTDDRSWDLSLWLEGEPGRKRVDASRPLVSFLEWLTQSNEASIGTARTAQIRQLQDDAGRTIWTPPGKFEAVRFHPLGIGKKTATWLPKAGNGALWDEFGVISPFVSTEALARLVSLTKSSLFLVSRAEELDKCASQDNFGTVHVLSDQALSSDSEDDIAHRQRGLHAKAYIGKRAWNTHLFVGSANATDAALVDGRNVEFVVELIGRGSKVGGPADWIGEEGLGPLLADYERSEPEDADALKDQRALESLRDALTRAPLALHCRKAESGWRVDLHGLDRIHWAGASAQAWLVSQDEKAWARPIDAARRDAATESCPGVQLGELASHQVTAFTGFTLVIGQATLSFVLKLPLHGGPEERDLEILHAAIRNREGLIRYLLLLLGDWNDSNSSGDGDATKVGRDYGALFDTPLFEMLARAYAHEPERLVRVRDLVERLRRKSASEQEHGVEPASAEDPILTEDFLEVWSVFEAALNNENRQ
ncbi:phospholipase D family protein [Burkholderia plantarii]|uniref:phospholipase D family protein n=1 Tax=Burkholderia plantarii TaxID=41899 RepID=UPI0006D8A0FD|nr:phospholipase D family protein [Burkholderia plantarii]ALK34982.1 hypothetical protein bpln_2g27910 [Burkholderia plantarii]GLZ19063.1 hypothetical protein Bpla01_25930 [Burkholderia plantarii]